MMTENGGIFVCKTRHLVLAGAGSGGGGRVSLKSTPFKLLKSCTKLKTDNINMYFKKCYCNLFTSKVISKIFFQKYPWCFNFEKCFKVAIFILSS